MNTSPKLQVELKNLDSITKNALNYFLSSNLCTNAILCKSKEKPKLLIIDNDRGVKDGFLQGLRNNNQYAIVLHNSADEFIDEERLIGLTKPIQQNELKKNIEAVFQLTKKNETTSEANQTALPKANKNHNATPDNQKTQQSGPKIIDNDDDTRTSQRFQLRKYVGSNIDVDLNSTNDLSHIYITPEKYLYFHLTKAITVARQNKSDVIINTAAGKVLYGNSIQQFYSSDWSGLELAQHEPEFEETKISLISDHSELYKGTAMSPVKAVWEAALLASKGRLPKGTNPNNNIEIIYWPDFSKLTMFKHTDQIIATWGKRAMSINTTAAQLKIPQRYVFAFYCAMRAINCIQVETEKTNLKEFSDPSSKDKLSNMFKRFTLGFKQ